jgi:hypothetical protein
LFKSGEVFYHNFTNRKAGNVAYKIPYLYTGITDAG